LFDAIVIIASIGVIVIIIDKITLLLLILIIIFIEDITTDIASHGIRLFVMNDWLLSHQNGICWGEDIVIVIVIIVDDVVIVVIVIEDIAIIIVSELLWFACEVGFDSCLDYGLFVE